MSISSRFRASARPSLALLAAAFVLAAAQPALSHEYKAGALEIDHPWTRATPAGAKVAGGYLVIRNKGQEADRLVSATAAIAGRSEIHEMAVKDGVMTMRQIPDGLVVPAGGELALAPGALHLMLFDLTRPLKKGERFDGALTFEKAGTVEVQFAVEAVGGPAADQNHDHKPGG